MRTNAAIDVDEKNGHALVSAAPKKSSVLLALSKEDAPRVFSPASLCQWLASQGLSIPSRSLSLALSEWSENGSVVRVNNRAYLNGRSRYRVAYDEAVPWLRPGAIVSLHRSLANVGALNTRGLEITAVVSSEDTTKVGSITTGVGTFKFASLPPSMIIAPGHALFHDAVEKNKPWCATPEKALLDWLYLASTPRGASVWPVAPSHEWNLSALNFDRLENLANGLNMPSQLFEFQGKVDLGALDPAPRRRRPR